MIKDEEKYREVSNIVYGLTQTYAGSKEGKAQAMREAYFERIRGYFARAMRIKSTGQWGCYVSLVRRWE
jgi:hypothetical protein